MANKKFSELTEVTTPNSESIFATAYDGDNFKVTLTNIAANMPSITTTGTVTGTTAPTAAAANADQIVTLSDGFQYHYLYTTYIPSTYASSQILLVL